MGHKNSHRRMFFYMAVLSATLAISLSPLVEAGKRYVPRNPPVREITHGKVMRLQIANNKDPAVRGKRYIPRNPRVTGISHGKYLRLRYLATNNDSVVRDAVTEKESTSKCLGMDKYNSAVQVMDYLFRNKREVFKEFMLRYELEEHETPTPEIMWQRLNKILNKCQSGPIPTRDTEPMESGPIPTRDTEPMELTMGTWRNTWATSTKTIKWATSTPPSLWARRTKTMKWVTSTPPSMTKKKSDIFMIWHNIPISNVTTSYETPKGFWNYNVYKFLTKLPQVVTAIRDNYKPVFRDCSKYKPTVPEEAPIGTEVLRVEAFDPDPPQSGGTINYQFVSTAGEKERFTIDPLLGIIRTADIFDRDEPSREKEIYITVRATDNGQPSLDDACSIKINITDINDNAPVFDKVAYSESIPKDTVEGREIMRITATDIDDGENSVVHYQFDKQNPDNEYFNIESDTGIIRLNKTLDKPVFHKFRLNVIVTDMGNPQQQSSITVDLTVVDSNRKPPSFIELPNIPIKLPENFADYTVPIAIIKAVSNVPFDEKVNFELVKGQTEQTNKLNTFLIYPGRTNATIKLGGPLNYESITEYYLTVRAQNGHKLASETVIQIEILDMNDNIPVFSDVHTGYVLENEPIGTIVMRVQAFDSDATSPNNQITYMLDESESGKVPFSINSKTGDIVTTEMLDREKNKTYSIKVIAIDGSVSSLLPNGRPNIGVQYFEIYVADRNDNPPHFSEDTYVAEGVAENANINELVTIVHANDVDTASKITYTIVDGNIGDAFQMSPTTGEIRVNTPLDYELKSHYVILVRAFDGIYEDYSNVIINIENLNDNPPVFVANYSKVIEEEKLYPGCVVRVEAYDPDIRDRKATQDISYSIVKKEQNDFLEINNDGCLRLTKPLNRDPPTGFVQWQILIMAADQGGRLGSDSLRSTTEVILELTDVNDNAPFLTNKQPIVVYENEPPHHVVNLTARDYDSPENGPPFSYYIDDTSDYNIRSMFTINDDKLYTVTALDRESERGKTFMVPIIIVDSGTPRMSGLSMLRVVVGDRNDNAMGPGSMTILAYKLENQSPDMEIGRVYVKDLDDWDLNDKNFTWAPSSEPQTKYFELNHGSGMITLKSSAPSGSYELKFNVSEEHEPQIPFHTVESTANVTVKVLPEEAIEKSGSFRFINVSAVQFIEESPKDGFSLKFKLQRRLAKLHNVSIDNVDIFTIFDKNTVNNNYLDVRYAVHNSPYYEKEKLDFMAASIFGKIEDELSIKIDQIGIDECINEKEQCEGSCRTVLTTSNVPLQIFTNTTSFVGITAKTEPECSCMTIVEDKKEVFCKNGGTQVGDRCECAPGYLGPRCEKTTISFHGDSWAMFPRIPACNEHRISFDLISHSSDALVFYSGPTFHNPNHEVPDHVALYLQGGYPTLLVNHGSGTTRLNSSQIDVSNPKSHLIEIILTTNTIEMFVDKCKLTSCMSLAAPAGTMNILNSQGPLMLGGLNFDLRAVSTQFDWSQTPYTGFLSGCISNFTINGIMLDMGDTKWEHRTADSCQKSISTAVTFRIDENFIIAICACLAILIILLLAVVIHRTRGDAWHMKELDDIRENIIAYEDEGGGEGDAGYDLQVLRQMYDGPPPDNDGFMHPAEGISGSGTVRPLPQSREESPGCCREHVVEMDEIVAAKRLSPLAEEEYPFPHHRDPHDHIQRRSVSESSIYHGYEQEPLVITEFEMRRYSVAMGAWTHGPIVNPNASPLIRSGPPRRTRSGLLSSVPDISGFLDGKKDLMDREVPEMAPFDDCRHYGYEGDGNSSGSLSSLASCTDDEDLKFSYLSTFGPRFRKLADMYGDSEDDRAPHEESWC